MYPQRAYTLIKVALFLAGNLALAGAFGALYFSGLWQAMTSALSKTVRSPVVSYLLTGLIASTIAELASLPVSFTSGFVVERSFQLSNMNLLTWSIREAKSIGVSCTLMSLACLVAYLITEKFPKAWPLLLGTTAAALIAISSYLYPVLITPIFYKSVPLANQAVSGKAKAIAEKAGIEIGAVYQIDSSRYTKKANAFLAGLGNTRRIILTDNLAEKYSPDEIGSIIAHELGHMKQKHVLIQTMLAAFSSWALIGAAFLIRNASFLQEHGEISRPSGLAFVIFAFIVISILTLPLQNSISRYFERRADLYSLAVTGDTDAFRSAQEKLSRDNMIDPSPPAVVELVFYSHPSTKERLKLATEYSLKH